MSNEIENPLRGDMNTNADFWSPRTLLNSFLALILIIASLPILLAISFLIFIQDGRPIIYRGRRLGQYGKPFTMYKFRTLAPNAEAMIGPKLITETKMIALSETLMSPIGKFLRNTRLDELPQLFNILKGDMVFIGPRPERHVVYQKLCQKIPGYNKRFKVKPGLIGYSQLFTPHSTPKRMRAMIDNRFLKSNQHWLADLILIAYTGWLVLKGFACELLRLLTGFFLKRNSSHGKIDNTVRKREKERKGHVQLEDYRQSGIPPSIKGVLVDIDEESFYFRTGHQLKPSDQTNFKLSVRILDMNREKKQKSASCSGTIQRILTCGSERIYEVKYSPLTPLNEYIIQQYFLRKSIAPISRLSGIEK